MAAITITVILATLLIVGYQRYLGAGAGPRCIANLRGLHVAFDAYIQDHGYWPQQPEFDPQDRKSFGQWWISTLYPYTGTDEIWRCPALSRLSRGSDPEKRSLIHYTPTIFDAFRNRPYQWSTQPWLMENGNPHAGSGHILFPDGSVRGSQELMQEWQ